MINLDFDSDYAYDDDSESDDIYDDNSSPSRDCKLIMYRRTYFRGPAVEVTEDVDDLDSLNFSNKLVSLKIQGDCDWLIFSGDKII